MHVSRREFLKTSAALLVAAKLAVPLEAIATLARQAKQGKVSGPVVRHVKSTCAHCVNFCGIDVKLENDVLRAIYPDPQRAPFYNVGICPKGVPAFSTPTIPIASKSR